MYVYVVHSKSTSYLCPVKVIQSITLNDLSVTMQISNQAFAPLADSELTLVRYRNPFGFSLQVVEVGETIILGSGGIDVAQVST